MRSILRAAPLALAFTIAAAVSAGAQQPAPKLAYLNSQQIIAAAPGRAEAAAQFEREMGTYRQQVQRMGDSLNKMVAEYDSLEVSLSPAAKTAKQKLIREKEEEFQQRTAQLEQQAQQRNAELMRPVMERIQKAIEDVRTEEGYAIIFDVASGAGVIVAADKNLDITDKVLRRLQTVASSQPGAKPAASEPAKPAAAMPAPAGVTRPRSPTR